MHLIQDSLDALFIVFKDKNPDEGASQAPWPDRRHLSAGSSPAVWDIEI